MKKDLAEKLIARLRAYRELKGLTQEAFAELAQISYKYYQAIEGGRKRDLRLSTLIRLARAHKLEVWELLSPPSLYAGMQEAPGPTENHPLANPAAPVSYRIRPKKRNVSQRAKAKRSSTEAS